MKNTFTFFLIGLLFACSEKGSLTPFPDFSNCNCGSGLEAVCGVDGKSYLNACLAECVGVEIADSNGNCDSSMIVLSDTMTWPIQTVCIPIQTQNDPEVLHYLSDGTVIYRRPDGTLFRGNQNLCRCLSPQACIDAPGGGIELQALAKGDHIFSLDEAGREIIVPVINIQKVPVGDHHRLVHLIMDDGTSLTASPMHPLADGRLLEHIQPHDQIQGREVATKTWRKAEYGFTMDLLPQGPTGVYRIDGYWYGTTMMQGEVGSR